MTKACLVVPEAFSKGRIFNISDPKLNRDDCIYQFYALRKVLADYNINLSTQDQNKPEESEIVIYDDMPQSLLPVDLKAKKILLLFENEMIRPDNWDLASHKFFDIIFTWDDRYAGCEKYRKLYYSNLVPKDFEIYARRPREKLCTLIAGNKSSGYPLELYSERLRAIEWFEQNHPEDFDLFGFGWDRRTFSGIFRPLNRISMLSHAFAKTRRSYRGPVKAKLDIFSNYKFAICYENLKEAPGYITEKIFDCLFAGCVPIYLGAPNIARYVPTSCFINRGDFPDYSCLYDYLVKMDESTHRRFIEAGIDFIKSDAMLPFTPEEFARSIAYAICEDK